ncbi:hypothetical protein M406DRAFT_52448 [Cryphonectria parasitica EP155]|uniref:Major facilitator superfamily (MFS) profile domain-containing protein n=1 Tax=Cryphonectria parasitica (strain ATCC 38755 / EP155) TaxID=660469 RepID=A0A9P4Y9C9_CRYP1|nr:uncharacterized protein M406DRAFT_52448 [Cryphonectria parasitica EP155]KAF3769374.1 hypothetical protein M406DRAFT_52448 [Cryphonectria parasitica EP155]
MFIIANGVPPVAAAHLVMMNTWGVINSFGVFQTYYATALLLPPSTISWIGSIQIFLLFFIGTFTGRLTDAGYFRPTFVTGTVVFMIGTFTTSVYKAYWQVFLAQGVCIGIGAGCLFCPTVAILSIWFSKNRGLALGIATAGSATGGLVFPAMARQLIPSIGFPWTIRAMGFVQLVTLIVANLTLKESSKGPLRKPGALVEWTAFTELDYTFYAMGGFIFYLGVYFAFYYLASFSRDIIGLTYTDSLNLLLILNGIGYIGRIVPNFLADRYGCLNVFILILLASTICAACWTAVSTQPGLYAWTSCYGIIAAGVQSLFPAALSSLTTDLSRAGVRMGMVFTIVSFATLTGNPIAGAIISASGGKYYGAQVYAASCFLVGGGFLVAARTVKSRKIGRGLWVKV